MDNGWWIDGWMTGLSGWMDGWMEGRKKGKVGEGGKWILDGWTDRWKNTEKCLPSEVSHMDHVQNFPNRPQRFQEDTSIFWSIRPRRH